MKHEEYMQLALEEATLGMEHNHGGPFGAIVVQDGKIIGRGHNMVTSTNDPTAHAEVVAIREACKEKGNFHLHDAVLYASCEPCPMCLSAIYWANIKTVYYCNDRVDAARIGFSDKLIYDEINLPIDERSVRLVNMQIRNYIFDDWLKKLDKVEY